MIAQLFHVEQSRASGTGFVGQPTDEARWSAMGVWTIEAVLTKVGRFVPRGTQRPAFRLNVDASVLREKRTSRGKERRNAAILQETAKTAGAPWDVERLPDTITEQQEPLQ